MKRTNLLITILVTIVSNSFSQNLSLNDLFSICNKPNWTEVDEYLLKKGWVYHESSKGDDLHYSTITWSYNKEYYSGKAQGWLHLMTYDGYPNKIAYNIFNKNAYTTIKNGISTLGMALKANSIEDDEIITNYENSNFIVKISTSKRYRDTYGDNSSTSYLITVIKKSGIYDPNNGLKKVYDDYGNIKQEYSLKNGELNGKATEYYSDGTVQKISYFVNGKRNGLTIEYDNYGNVISKANYLDNELDGSFKYYENKILVIEGTYKNGKKNGLFKEYDENGNLSHEYTMLNDLKNGISKIYENGKLKFYTEWKNDLENGKHKEYDENGFLIFEIDNENGVPNGFFKQYENNKLKLIGSVFNDEKNGVFKEYDEDGNIVKDYTMKSDMLDGLYTVYYYDSGKLRLKKTGNYKDDKEYGLWETILYNDKGIDILSSHIYLNGILNGPFKQVQNDSIIYGNYKYGYLDGDYLLVSVPYEINPTITGDSTSCIKLSKGKYTNGLKNGLWQYYFNNSLSEEGIYIKDKKEGKWNIYNVLKGQNGKMDSILLMQSEEYKDGVLNGEKITYLQWNIDSVKCINQNIPLDKCNLYHINHNKQISHYKNGKLDGVLESYDSNGNLEVKATFKDDILDGYFLSNTNGIKHLSGVLKDGKIEYLDYFDSTGANIKAHFDIYNENKYNLNCKFTYYENNIPKSIRTYLLVKATAENIKVMDFFKFFINSLSDTSQNSTSYINGEAKYFDNNGKISSVGSEFRNKRIGIWRFYNHSSDVFWEIDFDSNNPIEKYYFISNGQPFNGVVKELNYKGGLASEIKVSNGIRNGKTIFYDSAGKIILIEKYKDGVKK